MADDLAQGPAADALGQPEAPAPEGEYCGKLYRGEHEGTVQGWLRDRLGYRIEFGGTKDHRRDGGYILVGRLAHIPEHLRQPAIDDEVA